MFYVCVNNMKNYKLVKLGGYLWGWITENLIFKFCIYYHLKTMFKCLKILRAYHAYAQCGNKVDPSQVWLGDHFPKWVCLFEMLNTSSLSHF